LVIDRWRLGYPSLSEVLLDALQQVVTADDKAFIVARYPDKVGLIQLIRKFHWERDVKKVLVDQLGNSSGSLPADCAEALAELRDPQHVSGAQELPGERPESARHVQRYLEASRLGSDARATESVARRDVEQQQDRSGVPDRPRARPRLSAGRWRS
jgi:hypothetical protein